MKKKDQFLFHLDKNGSKNESCGIITQERNFQTVPQKSFCSLPNMSNDRFETFSSPPTSFFLYIISFFFLSSRGCYSVKFSYFFFVWASAYLCTLSQPNLFFFSCLKKENDIKELLLYLFWFFFSFYSSFILFLIPPVCYRNRIPSSRWSRDPRYRGGRIS